MGQRFMGFRWSQPGGHVYCSRCRRPLEVGDGVHVVDGATERENQHLDCNAPQWNDLHTEGAIMPAPNDATKPLTNALALREREMSDAIDRLRERDDENPSDTWLLREAVELVRCLRRLTAGRTAHEIHEAFGAPGDFGYETPIGAALQKVYGG